MNTVRWFGRNLGAPIYEDCPQVPAPVGIECMHCHEAIEEGDDGFLDAIDNVFHRACFLRGILGSVAHQLKLCSCYGIHEPEPESVSIREEAELAVALYEHEHPRRPDDL